MLTAGLISCGQQTTKTERKDQPDIYTVADEDKEMNAAIEKSRHTITEFDKAFISKNSAYGSYSLKTKFNTQDGGEHIWVSNLTAKDGNYFGVVDNLPESTTDVELGDTIRIDKATISDWMFLEGQRLHGGYTIRLLRDRMSPDERKDFDQQNGLIIE